MRTQRACGTTEPPVNNLSNAPKGNGKGATGSKNPPRILEPLLFSARYGSKNSGLVLRPLCPYTVALWSFSLLLCKESNIFGAFRCCCAAAEPVNRLRDRFYIYIYIYIT